MGKNDKVYIGLLGLGTVGSGVFETLRGIDNVEVKKVADKDTGKMAQYPELTQYNFTTNADDIIDDPDIKILVELMGGTNPAFDFIKRAIQNGKHIVTANKELIAKHGKELFELAKANNVVIMYEAAVAGGIPVIMPLKQSLAGNTITRVLGILNGTTNYILTKMEEEGSDFEDVLKEAQQLGYAEADPTGDVKGHDAAYKIAILSALAFNKRVDINQIYREGIDKISAVDIEYAAEFGYKIKLIGLAQNGVDNTLDVRVHPLLIPKDHPISRIDGVLNAIVIEGFPVSRVMFSGPGAGKFPTASSVVGDIIAIVNELGRTDYPLPMMRCQHTSDAPVLDIDETLNKYYIRVNAANEPGVIGDLGIICGKNNINLCSIIQKGVLEDGSARIVLLTDLAYEKDIKKAVNEIEERSTTKYVANVIRVME
ncbi:MAG: hypothetical protein ACD_20C00337G0008 [uncultured bacterium]|nr:MAG: hypothetical protein ACD_20C00337G0008 [uncultured bacterium]HBH18014.1 homoserine dehydrogenase [Cyanobacteria bacterium UBA9579]